MTRKNIECPSDECPYCTGEACRLCNLPARSNDVVIGQIAPCEHDVLDRHAEPGDYSIANAITRA